VGAINEFGGEGAQMARKGEEEPGSPSNDETEASATAAGPASKDGPEQGLRGSTTGDARWRRREGWRQLRSRARASAAAATPPTGKARRLVERRRRRAHDDMPPHQPPEPRLQVLGTAESRGRTHARRSSRRPALDLGCGGPGRSEPTGPGRRRRRGGGGGTEEKPATRAPTTQHPGGTQAEDVGGATRGGTAAGPARPDLGLGLAPVAGGGGKQSGEVGADSDAPAGETRPTAGLGTGADGHGREATGHGGMGGAGRRGREGGDEGVERGGGRWAAGAGEGGGGRGGGALGGGESPPESPWRRRGGHGLTSSP
jgi:hypothetical protein